MNVHAPRDKILTVDDFLRWADGREGRYEFVRGKIVDMMTGGSQRHAELCLRLGAWLMRPALDAGFGIANDWAVATFAGIRYPDVVIFPREASGRTLLTREPIFAAEILSPSSLAIDFNEKAEEYTAIDSLAHYLVLAQDEPRAWTWGRDAGGVFDKPEMIVGRDEVVPLAALACSLPLAEVYRGIA